MAQYGGGWYSEPYILPLPSDNLNDNAISLPNGGNFTMHTSLLPELLSGKKEEWMKISFLMMTDPHNNDVRILKNLLHANPALYHVEDHIIGAKYLYDVELSAKSCEVLNNKVAVKYSYQIAYQAGITRKKYDDAVESSLKAVKEKCYSPKIHIFFDPSSEDNLNDDFDVWKKAWKDAGWQPIILTIDDAKQHPDFERFERAFLKAEYKASNFQQMRVYRWLAMAVSGGGWMSDYDVLPLSVDLKRHGMNLPNEGKLTTYAKHAPCLVSGSAKEWNRVSSLLLFSYSSHSKESWSEEQALEEIQSFVQGTVDASEVITIDDLYKEAKGLRSDRGLVLHPYMLKELCNVKQRKKAVHFSEVSCYRVEFCRENKSAAISKWLQAWKEKCL